MIQGAFNLLTALFSDNNKLIIPDLQRDYCWGETVPNGKKTSLVYNFTNDLVNDAQKQSSIKEYSYGIIYTYEYPDSFLYLCDGQQRLTTLYLILGVLNCYVPSSGLISLLQLSNSQPRLKYEVRNSTDYFIKDLLHEVFLKQKFAHLDDIKKATWFRGEYENDPSVSNMVKALKDIKSLVNTGNAEEIKNYILDKIGFVYIKLEANDVVTEKTYSIIREYGEKMYEIVNTCGDPMEKNEHQKSILLSKLCASERIEGTEKWEIWQDFFWQNRPEGQLSADESFNAFLDWIEDIEKAKDLSFVIIESYFKAFFLLIGIQERLAKTRKFEIVNVKTEFKRNNKPQTIVLYPCLVKLVNTEWVSFDGTRYFIKFDEVDYDSFYRYMRFFSNLAKSTEAKTEAVLLAKSVGQKSDVVDFLYLGETQFDSILTEEEKFKLRLYKSCKDENERKALEDRFWEAEDHQFLNGKVTPILAAMDGALLQVDFTFLLSEFIRLYEVFLDLTGDLAIEQLRIAMLASSRNFWEFHDGWSTTMEGHRYYLGKSGDSLFWRKHIQGDVFKGIFTQLAAGITIALIIDNCIARDTDEYRKKVIAFLHTTKVQNSWCWMNGKRFILVENTIFFPYNIKVTADTDEYDLDSIESSLAEV